jgi:fructose-1,6-bisphosphatase
MTLGIRTPENIQVNAFMYEPIIDMGEGRLRKLYEDVIPKALLADSWGIPESRRG